MPYIFSTNYEYKNNNYQINIADAINRFPFLADKNIDGEILAAYIENKVIFIRQPFRCRVNSIEQYPNWIGIISVKNPLKDRGIPPCDLCVALYKYEEIRGNRPIEYPIMENEIIRGTTGSRFDDILRRLAKEEEIRIMIETTSFHPDVKRQSETLRDAYISFEEQRFADTKTSCRKILENLKNKSKDWKTIDGSESICEKMKDILKSMYSFASTGGPHEGINTQDETALILKAVSGILFYINILLKGDRISLATTQSN